MLQFLQEQDILIVESLDRLSQNYNHIIYIVQELNRKEIGLIALIATISIQ